MISPETASGAVRSPKTAELVARTLRRMVVEGQLKDGDFLPHEAELITHFQVSRPTLREAVRVLESERLVEVRRGSRTGAKVRVPGAEIVARPAGLLLAVSGATLADVITANLHRRMVELSGNATLGMIAGMLHEISERHTAAAFLGVQNVVPKAQYNKVVKSYHRLVDLVTARKGAEAETHWRRHMEAASAALLKGHEKTKVRDIMD
jgi:DNA-binding FadR family transcriptional regulator